MADDTTDIQKQDFKPLTKERLKTIQAKVAAPTFLREFASKLDEHGPEMLEGLFEIACGHVKIKRDADGEVLGVDVKDRMSAIRLILEMGAFKDVSKALLKIAMKGRPQDGSESEIPDWATPYADDEEAPVDVEFTELPPKKSKGE